MKDIWPVRMAAVEFFRLEHARTDMAGARIFGRGLMGFEASVL